MKSVGSRVLAAALVINLAGMVLIAGIGVCFTLLEPGTRPLYAAVSAGAQYAPLIRQLTLYVAVIATVLLFSAASLSRLLGKLILRPVEDLTEAAERLARGDISASPTGDYSGEIQALAEAFQAVEDCFAQQSELLRSIAGSKVSRDTLPRSGSSRTGDFVTGARDALYSAALLADAVARQVSGEGLQISDTAQALSREAAEQGSALRELRKYIAEIAGSAEENSRSAKEAACLSGEAGARTEAGIIGAVQTAEALRGIDGTVGSISAALTTIDDLAFRTKLLSLNAAVEAAHAGAQGRGFAVIAGEVRSLAEKTAEAAAEAVSLLESIDVHARIGLSAAGKTENALGGIAGDINRVAGLMEFIALSSGEQRGAAAVCGASINGLEQAGKLTGAAARECAVLAENMNLQADMLEELASRLSKSGGALSLSGLTTSGGREQGVIAPESEGQRKRESAFVSV